MRTISFIAIGIITLTTCGRTNKTDTNLACSGLKQRLNHQLTKLSEFKARRRENVTYLDDSIPKVNRNIFSLIQDMAKTKGFQDCDLNSEEVTSISSNDNKLRFISWDTKEGGTMMLFATAVVFWDGDSVRVNRLMEEQDTSIESVYEIHMIQNDRGQNLYLVKGISIGSSIDRREHLTAYAIDNGLNPIPIFPEAQSGIHLDYLISESAVEIQILDNGKTLLIPILDDNGSSTGKIKELHFNGSTFASPQQKL
jgi:hypothetical protein